MLYTKYLQFINENFYEDFKKLYLKLFNDADDDIKNELGMLFKKIDDETDYLKVVNIFNNYLSANQNTLNSKIDKSEDQDTINKLLSDNLNAIFFALRSIQIKLNDKDFINVFEKARDKNLTKLMNMKRDKFSDSSSVYAKDYMIPQIEEMAGIKKVQKVQEADEPVAQPNVTQPAQTEQQDKSKQLDTYKEKSKEWFGYIYSMIWEKLKKVKAKMTTDKQLTSNIDQLSKLMKSSDNEEAKKQLLKKIISLPKEELNKVGKLLNLNIEELGDF